MTAASTNTILEFASYLPRESAFRDVVSSVYGGSAVDNYKVPRRRRIPAPQSPDIVMRFPGGPSPEDPVGNEEAGNRKLKSLAKLPESRKIVQNFSIAINVSNQIDSKTLHEISELTRKAEKEALGSKLGKELKGILIGIFITVSGALIAEKLSTPQSESAIIVQQNIGVYRVNTEQTSLNVRASPEFTSSDNIIGSIERLETVFVLRETDTAYEIECSQLGAEFFGKTCYVHKDYLERVAVVGTG